VGFPERRVWNASWRHVWPLSPSAYAVISPPGAQALANTHRLSLSHLTSETSTTSCGSTAGIGQLMETCQKNDNRPFLSRGNEDLREVWSHLGLHISLSSKRENAALSYSTLSEVE
jgi:hypothetical protein